MANLSDAQWLDLANMTLRKMDQPNFVQVAQDQQDYEAMPRIFKKHIEIVEDGRGIEWYLMYRTNNAARRTDYASNDVLVLMDKWTKATADWVERETSWVTNRIAMAKCRGSRALVRMFQQEEAAAMLDYCKMQEEDWFGPVPDASDAKGLHGLFYHITVGATDGFTGLNPTGHTSWCGIDRSLAKNANMRNWSFKYKTVSRQSLVKQVRLACYKTDWKSPVGFDARKFSNENLRILSNYNVTSTLTDLAQQQNDNQGSDLAMYEGEAQILRHPVVPIRFLDDNPDWTNNPVIGVNYQILKPCALSGNNMRRSDAHSLAPIKHNWYGVWIDSSITVKCYDPRRLWIGVQDAAASL